MNESDIKEARSNTGALLAVGALIGRPQQNPHPDGQAFVIVPKASGDWEIQYLDRPMLPSRRIGTVNVFDVQSFIEATNRYALKMGTVIYAQLKPGACFTAVLNDHPKLINGDTAAWRDHRVHFALGFSKEYETWTGRMGKPMSQEEFAFFIEDNLPDFQTPNGAKMLEIALNFKVNRKVNFKSAISLSDGTTELQYSDVADGGAIGQARKMPLPETFIFKIPVWSGLNQDVHQFEARLRYKVADGALAIRFDITRPHKVVETAYQDVLSAIRKGVKNVPVIFGAP